MRGGIGPDDSGKPTKSLKSYDIEPSCPGPSPQPSPRARGEGACRVLANFLKIALSPHSPSKDGRSCERPIAGRGRKAATPIVIVPSPRVRGEGQDEGRGLDPMIPVSRRSLSNQTTSRLCPGPSPQPSPRARGRGKAPPLRPPSKPPPSPARGEREPAASSQSFSKSPSPPHSPSKDGRSCERPIAGRGRKAATPVVSACSNRGRRRTFPRPAGNWTAR